MLKKINDFIGLYKNWWMRLLNHRISLKGQIRFDLRNNLSLIADANSDDDGIIEDIYLHKVYIQKGISIEPGMVVVDIGAQKGYFSLYADKLCGAKVYAYEPEPHNYKVLRENIVSNLSSVYTYNKAVGKEGGTGRLMCSTSGSHSLYIQSDLTKIIPVTIITLREVIEMNNLKKIDLLKLDCEGAEYDILYNSDLSTISQIAMEVHSMPNHTPEKLKEYLELNGFVGHYNWPYIHAKRRV